MSKHRMELFSDAVFAIVITLLILDLRPPDVSHFTFSALSNVGAQVFAFVLSFVMVGMCWVAHHNMATFLKGVDRVLLWLNLFLLLTVVFLPFSTAILGRHLGDRDAVILYGVNLLFVNVAGTLFWLYGGSKLDLRLDGLSNSFVFKWARLHAIPNSLCILGIALAPWHTGLSLLLYTLPALFFILPNPITNRFLKGRENQVKR
jgi:TMEM175 potassium channel family protein